VVNVIPFFAEAKTIQGHSKLVRDADCCPMKIIKGVCIKNLGMNINAGLSSTVGVYLLGIKFERIGSKRGFASSPSARCQDGTAERAFGRNAEMCWWWFPMPNEDFGYWHYIYGGGFAGIDNPADYREFLADLGLFGQLGTGPNHPRSLIEVRGGNASAQGLIRSLGRAF
jgi:hypothetical protein